MTEQNNTTVQLTPVSTIVILIFTTILTAIITAASATACLIAGTDLPWYVWVALVIIGWPIFFTLIKALLKSNVSSTKVVSNKVTTAKTATKNQVAASNIIVNSFVEVERAALLEFIKFLESHKMLIAGKDDPNDPTSIFAICCSHDELLNTYFKYVEMQMQLTKKA